jgi:hypothetical protein
MSPQDLDHIGIAAQAARDAELEKLRNDLHRAQELAWEYSDERDAALATIKDYEANPPGIGDGDVKRLLRERDEDRAQCLLMEDTIILLQGRLSDLKSLERSFARAIDAQVTAERARDDAWAERQKLLEENRELRRRLGADL